MFFKLISANLRRPICSTLSVASGHSTHVTRNKLLQIIALHGSCRQYSTDKFAPYTGKNTNIINNNEKLSQKDIQILNKDPDNFGTLSLLTPENPEESKSEQNETKSKPTSKRKRLSHKKWTEENEKLLKQVIAEKGIREAIEVFENQIKERILPEVRIFEWLIDECIRFNIHDKAFELYQQMMSRSLTVSLSTIEKLVKVLESNELSIQKAHTIRNIISAQGQKPNAIIYNALIRIYIRANKSPIGIELANEMTQSGYVYEFDTLNLLLELCPSAEDNGFIRMLELWHEMQQLHYPPDENTLNAVLKTIATCQINDIVKLKETIESICTKYVQNSSENIEKINGADSIDDGKPNLLKRHPSIGFLLPLEDVTTPEKRLLLLGGLSEILKIIRVHAISPTLETITILLNLIPNSFVAQNSVLRLLKKHNIAPDANIFHSLLTQTTIRKNFNDAQEIMDMMHSFDVPTDVISYALLAMNCKTAKEAQNFFIEADENKISYNADILNAMLKNACAYNDNDFLISIIRQMKTREIEPMIESVDMVEAYQKKILHNMRSRRIQDKHTRNECFKLIRECKQWLRHFKLDKRWTDAIEPIRTKKYVENRQNRKSRKQ